MRTAPAGTARRSVRGGPRGPPGQAKREGPDLGESEHTLQQKQKQLKEERAKVAQAKKREASLLAELEEIEKRLGDKRRQVAVLDGRVKKAQADVSGLQGEIGRLEMQRSGQEEALGRRLRLSTSSSRRVVFCRWCCPGTIPWRRPSSSGT